MLQDHKWGFTKFILQDLSEMLANIIAIISIWKIMKEERRELQSMNGLNDNSSANPS